MKYFPSLALLTAAVLTFTLGAQKPAASTSVQEDSTPSSYILGPEDQIMVRVAESEELNEKAVRISSSGFLSLPLLGRVKAAGLSVDELEADLTERLRTYIQDPRISVSVVEFKSQPISIIGAVNNPGIHHLQGRRTLVEALSVAGGLRQDAGHAVKITRGIEWGRIPLRSAATDSTGQFTVAEVSLKAVLEARNPAENIVVRPHDVISVPRADTVYVIGDVSRPGGFVLNERETLTVLQALTLAGGLTRTSKSSQAKIMHPKSGASAREETALDLKRILAGKAQDLPMSADDILFVPSSTGKSVAYRSLEAAIGMGANIGTGVAIYRH